MKDTSEITRDVLRRRDEWQQERTNRRRGLNRIMAALLVAAALCGGTVAAGSNPLADFFMGYRGGDLSPEQEAVASLAVEIERRTAVSGDWTVTVDNTICDGLNYYLTMSVSGPEGWMEDNSMVEWAAVEFSAGGQTCKWMTKRLWHELERTEEGTDYYVMCVTLDEPAGESLTMELRDMILLRGEPGDRQIVEESWVFENLEFAVAGDPVELLTKPVMIRTGNAMEEGICNVRLESVELRTFAIHISYACDNPATVPDPECLLVLKDGTTYELHFSCAGDAAGGILESVFGFPVLPEEVDHILIEGIRLDIP